MPLRYAPTSEETYVQPLTIRHLLDANVLSATEQVIVYREQARFSYADLRDRIDRLAGVLRDIGVEEGTTVAVLDWDSHRYLESFFAIPMMGAVLQTANVRLSADQLRYTLDHAGAEVLLVHRDFLHQVDELRTHLPKVRAVVAIMDDATDTVPDWCVGEYEKLLAVAAPYQHFADFDENALATTFYTSGTTGLPKAVCFTHRQLVLHTLALTAALASAEGPGFRRGDVYMPLTPMFHVHAWGLPFAATMLGLKQVYPGKYDPQRIVRMRQDEGVTFSHCVPTVLRMVLDAARRDGTRLDGWHFVIGGSAVTRELFDEARSVGAAVTTGYGMSETGPIVAVGRAGADPYDGVRSGTPVPLVSAAIVDDAMQPLACDDQTYGELVLRAPWLTPCYVGDATASQALWRGGWLHTQDIATIDRRGSIQIRDRLKDVIKTGGEWICSLTLEDLLAARDDVAEVAVVGVPDPLWHERPVAVVVATPGANPDLEALQSTLTQAAANGVISRYAVVDAVYRVHELPRTSVGKIDKKAIRLALASAA